MKKFLTPEKMQEFERYLRREERSEATVEKYMRDVRAFSSFVGKSTVDKQDVLAYKHSLLDRYTVASANSMIAAMNCFLRFVGCHDVCVKQFKMQKELYRPEEKELTKAEYVRLVSAAGARKNERLGLVIQTICGTGIRVSELQYVTVESLAGGEAVVNCKGKNRRIFIVPELRKKLARYAKERGITHGAIFVTRGGRPISRHTVWREMKSLCADAGVAPGKVFPHNLRHLFARTFYGIEKDIAKLADILGHASINTTRIYIVTTGAEHKRKMEGMRLIL